MKKILLFCLFLVGCGMNGEQKFTQGGQSYTYFVVRIELIDQIRQMCNDLYISEDFASEKLYKQAVAQCVFKNLSLAGISQTQGNAFVSQYCSVGADLSKFNDTEKANIQATCSALGY